MMMVTRSSSLYHTNVWRKNHKAPLVEENVILKASIPDDDDCKKEQSVPQKYLSQKLPSSCVGGKYDY